MGADDRRQARAMYAVNGLMRGAAVPAGTHRLVYSYAPRSFLVGRVGSIVGLGVLALVGIACVWRPVDSVLGVCDNLG